MPGLMSAVLRCYRTLHLHHPTQMTVDAVKRKVNTMCGTSVQTMVLQLKDEGGRLVAQLSDDSRKLGFYSRRNG